MTSVRRSARIVRFAGRAIVLAALGTSLVGGCGDAGKTIPGYCPAGGDSSSGTGNLSGGAGGATEAGMAGTPSMGGESASGSAGEGGAAGTNPGESGAGGRLEGGRGGGGGAAGLSGGSGNKGGSSASAGKSGAAQGGSSNAGATSKGGQGGASAGSAGTTAKCGDHIVQSGEQCDDGNTTYGDGCSSCRDTAACDGCWNNINVADEPLPFGPDDIAYLKANCFSTDDPTAGGAPAPQGPAQGTPAALLCQAALTCILKSGCLVASADPSAVVTQIYATCRCGLSPNTPDAPTTCATNGALGPCAKEILNASEPPVPNGVEPYILQVLNDPTVPMGAAALVLESQAFYCGNSCFANSAGNGGTSFGGQSGGGSSGR